MFGLYDGEEITTALFVLIQYYSVTDRQTDGRTDRHLCYSSHTLVGVSVKTRVFGLSVSEEITTLALFILIHYQSVTDRQTDGRTSLL